MVVMDKVPRVLLRTAAGMLLCIGPLQVKAGSEDLTFSNRVVAPYDEAIRLNPDDAFALYNRAKAFLELGDKVRAIADFRRALELGVYGAIEDLHELGITVDE